MLLRSALSRRLSAAIAERFCPAAPEAARARTYSGWFERLTRRVPDAIEDAVLRRAYETRVDEQVRRKFLEVTLESVFMPLIALAAYLTGYLLTRLGALTAGRLIFVVRAVSLTIFARAALCVWKSWDALSFKALSDFYREYGLNVARFVEFQIAAEVEREAALRIDARVRRLGAFERVVYRVFSDGTAHYARVISRRAVERNRAAIRGILAVAALAAASYYAVLVFLIAPLVRRHTGESFFRFVFLDPAVAALRFAFAHPAFHALILAAGLAVWHKRALLPRAIAPAVNAARAFFKNAR